MYCWRHRGLSCLQVIQNGGLIDEELGERWGVGWEVECVSGGECGVGSCRTCAVGGKCLGDRGLAGSGVVEAESI